MKFQYLMETDLESVRLLAKDRPEQTLQQLLDSGMADLPAQPHVIDAGTGAGVVARQMAEVLSRHYQGAKLTLLDGSQTRLEAAAKNLSSFENLDKQFVECNLENIPLPDNSVDYLFCRFVFEYLANPQRVFDEYVRIMKPGGKLVIGDLDNNSLNHYPLPDVLQAQLDELSRAVESRGLLDFSAGRKLYSFFHKAGLDQIRVRLYAHHLFYGQLDQSDDFNWSKKMEQMVSYQDRGLLDVSFDVRKFGAAFLEFLRSPGRFSYTPLILVEGVKLS